jgi:hypothetical protein
MRAADALRFLVPSAVSSSGSPPCRRAWRASASAPHVAPHPASRGHVQASCLARARPRAVATFAGALAARRVAPPGRRRPERQRRAKAEGKIKGRGTPAREKPVCTWGWRGTRQGAAACREGAPCLADMGAIVCFVRQTAMALEGAAA